MLIPNNYYVYVAVFIAHIGGFIASATISWSSSILSKLKQLDDNPLGRAITDSEESFLSSIPTLGGLVGSFMCGFISKRYGRRHGFIFEGIPSLLAYGILTFSTTVWEMYVARFLAGLTMGSFFTVNTMYAGEVAENSNRGLLGTAMALFMKIGTLSALVLGPLISFKSFHIIMSIIPAIFVTLTFFFVPESPYFSVKNDVFKAETSLKKLRGRNDVKTELEDIKRFVENCPKASFGDVQSNRSIRKLFVIGSALIFFQQFSGFVIIQSYAEQIFHESGEKISSKVGPIIIGVVNLIMACVTPLIVDRAGRKILLLISHVLTSLTLIPLGLYYFLNSNNIDVDNIFWLPLASLIAYGIVFAIGVDFVPWTIIGEIFPLEYKEAAMGVCNLVTSLVSFSLLQSFNPMKNSIGIGPTFWIYSILGMIGGIFVKYYVIETKGRSFEEIQKMLNT